jgi:hypothetical protein
MTTLFILVVFIVRAGSPEVETAMYRTMDQCRERAALLASVPPTDMGLDALGAVCVTTPKFRENRS